MYSNIFLLTEFAMDKYYHFTFNNMIFLSQKSVVIFKYPILEQREHWIQ